MSKDKKNMAKLSDAETEQVAGGKSIPDLPKERQSQPMVKTKRCVRSDPKDTGSKAKKCVR